MAPTRILKTTGLITPRNIRAGGRNLVARVRARVAKTL
jgi:hypothetical protein